MESCGQAVGRYCPMSAREPLHQPVEIGISPRGGLDAKAHESSGSLCFRRSSGDSIPGWHESPRFDVGKSSANRFDGLLPALRRSSFSYSQRGELHRRWERSPPFVSCSSIKLLKA